MPRYTDEQLDQEVLFMLKQHIGQEAPIGRWEMVAKIYGPVAAQDQNDGNYSDRQIRESVERLRKNGILVCDMADGTGRFLAKSLEEYQSFRMKYGSRAFTVIETLREMDKSSESQWGNVLQPRLL
jgi:hypothetical protein